MGAPGHTTALREETFENLQLNAGIVLKNCDYSSIANAGALKTALAAAVDGTSGGLGTIVGATRGGGSFVVTREMRQPEVDGRRYGFVGDTFVDSVEAKLSTTLIEMTPENLVDAFGSATAITSGQKTTIKLGTAIDTDDYLTNICWVGDLADGRYVLICLDNALNQADFNLTWTDKGEGTLPVEFHAKQSSVDDYDYAPFEIVYFDGGTAAALTVTSAEGTTAGATALSTTNVLGNGEKYVYKIGTSGSAPNIDYHEHPDYSWTQWDGTSELSVGTAADGKKATVAVINNQNQCIKSGAVTLDVKMT